MKITESIQKDKSSYGNSTSINNTKQKTIYKNINKTIIILLNMK